MRKAGLKGICVLGLLLTMGFVAGCRPTHTRYSPNSYLQRYATGRWVIDRDASSQRIAALPAHPTVTIRRDSKGTTVIEKPGREPTPEEVAERSRDLRRRLDDFHVLIELNGDQTGRLVTQSDGSEKEVTFEWKAPNRRPVHPVYLITTTLETGKPGPTFKFRAGDPHFGARLELLVPALHWTIVCAREQ